MGWASRRTCKGQDDILDGEAGLLQAQRNNVVRRAALVCNGLEHLWRYLGRWCSASGHGRVQQLRSQQAHFISECVNDSCQ